MERSLQISAIVLAAGRSSRMQEFKLGMAFKNHTILEEVLQNVRAARPAEIVVVTGHYQSATMNIVKGYPDVRTVHNPHYATGMSSSIRAGLLQSNPFAEGMLVCLSDMPLIPPTVYQALVEHFCTGSTDPQIIRPCFRGKPGNPVLFSAHFREDLLQLAYPEGARELVKANRDKVRLVEVGTPGIFQDIDTPDQYAQWAQ